MRYKSIPVWTIPIGLSPFGLQGRLNCRHLDCVLLMISSMYACSPNVCSTHITNGRIPNGNIQFKWGTNNYIVQMEGVQFWEPVQMRVDCNDTKQQKKNKNLSPQNFSTSIFLNLSDDLITKSIHKHSLSLWSETVQ